MNDKKAAWQRTFVAFAGRGIQRPSDMMRVSESEARSLRAGLAALDWLAPVYTGTGRHAGYTVRNAANTYSTALFYAGAIVGFYAGSSLWIARGHRKLGLSTPLILAAAGQRGGSILPPGTVLQGYTPAGVAAHRAAHSHAVLLAQAEGLAVPVAVLMELEADESRLRPPAVPCACPAPTRVSSRSRGAVPDAEKPAPPPPGGRLLHS